MKWDHYLHDRSANMDVDHISETVDALFEHIFKNGFSTINLCGLKVDDINPMHLAVALRVLSRNKAQVAGWHEALSVATESCLLNGLDPADVLFGLSD